MFHVKQFWSKSRSMTNGPHINNVSKPGGPGMSCETVIGGPKAFQDHFVVSNETLAKLETYAAVLIKWQKTINLVAPGTLDAIWHRHFADCAQLLAFAPPSTKRWVDFGSGAGFPGLVIAIMVNDAGFRAAGRARLTVTLIESDQRKCAFLREAARQTSTVVDIVGSRIESSTTQSRVGLQDVVSARALAPLSGLLSYPGAFQGPHTVGLFLKGRDAAREVDEARRDWSFKADLHPSLTDPAARIVVVSELQAHAG
jgi:16S rRNA (guanine527-N7)-methyltransferase